MCMNEIVCERILEQTERTLNLSLRHLVGLETETLKSCQLQIQVRPTKLRYGTIPYAKGYRDMME